MKKPPANWPCPNCGYAAGLRFERDDRGHLVRGPDSKPVLLALECIHCGSSFAPHRDDRYPDVRVWVRTEWPKTEVA